MKISRLNNKKTVIICYVLLLVILQIFHSLIGLYFDDYGNASLSYGYDAGVMALDWTFGDLFDWAKWIYMNFSGRILCGSILNLLIKWGGGPRLFMAVQALVVWGLFSVMYRLTLKLTGQKCNVWFSILIVALFFMMPSDMYRWNLCWASASVLYVWPLLPFFSAVYLQLIMDADDTNTKKNKIRNVVCFLCIVLTAFSHEQTGLAIAVYMVAYVVIRKLGRKEICIRNIVYACVACVVYGFLFGAPGNWSRLDGNTEFAQLSLIGKIQNNYQPIMECIFNLHFCTVYLCVSVGVALLCYRRWKEKTEKDKNKGKLPFIASSISLVLIVAIMVCVALDVTTGLLVLSPCYLFTVCYVLVAYHWDNEKYWANALLLAAAASAFCVLISPALPLRCFTEWILIIHIISLEIVYDVWKAEKHRRNTGILYTVAFLVVCAIAAKNFGGYCIGYFGNQKQLQQNDEILRKSEGESPIYLSKLSNDYFAPVMPYAEGYSYIEYWMKQYYGLDESQEFIWTKNDLIDEITDGDFYEDGWFGEEGSLLVKKPCRANTLCLRIYLPDDEEQQELEVTINDQKKQVYQIASGWNEIAVDLRYGKRNEINFYAPNAKQHGEDDERELSVMLYYYFE